MAKVKQARQANLRSWLLPKPVATFLKSTAAFPVLLFLLIIVLCAFKIHGSSVGIYNQIFYE